MGTNDAQLADILARLAAAEQELAARRVRAPRHRRAGRLAAVSLALLLTLVPLAVRGASFVDLNAGSAHNANIVAIADAGITRGCTDVSHYCPNDYVTREQMASFLARTAGLGDNPPVANAATLGGRRADGLARGARGGSGRDYFRAEYFYVPAAAVYPNFVPMPGATVTIAAPGDGFVLITAVVGSFHNAGEGPHIRLRDTTPGAGAVSHAAFGEADVTSSGFDQVAVTWVFPVTGAGPKTFGLEVSQHNAGTGDLLFSNDILTALYVPFGYDGGASLAP